MEKVILPEILIVASPENQDVQSVLEYLKKKYPHKVVYVFDLSLFPTQICYEILINQGTIAITHYQNDIVLSLEKLHSIWWWQPQIPKLSSSILDPEHARFAYIQCCQLVEGLWYILDCLWINHPERQEIALNPIYQIVIAQKAGFIIPETLVTSRPETLISFWEKHHHKMMYHQMIPIAANQEDLKEEDMEEPERLQLSPVLFQPHIHCKNFLTAVVVGDFLLLAQYCKNAEQFIWKQVAAENLRDLPTKIKKLMALLGLSYFQVQLGIDDKENYIFFSLDPLGSFLDLENQTGVHISEVLAELLVRGYGIKLPKIWPGLDVIA